MFLPKPVEMQRQCAQSSSCMENPTFGIIRVQKQGGACHDILTTQVNNIRQLQGTLDTHFSINSYIWQHLISLVWLLLQAIKWWWSLAATCAGGIFPSAICANTPCTGGGATHCNLCWWSFSFHPVAHILHLCLSNLHYVVVIMICGGGSFM